jgi:CheY-like chemotaxis protein
VEISTRNPTPDILCIEVRDNGRGIRAETLAAIFQPFEQGDAGINATYGGLGLGLAISKKVLDAHGGSIRAESRGLGMGAQFFVEMRAVDAAPKENAAAEAIAPDREIPPNETRILLVEDHDDTLQTLLRLLKRRGYQVVPASNAEAASALAEAERFDLVISDVGLPDRSGLELMTELREKHKLHGIALSGYGMEADIERSHGAGFVAHLTKPIDFAALEKAITWALVTPRT